MDKNQIKTLIENEVIVKKNNKEEFFMIHKNSPWLFDFRRVFLKWEFLEKFCQYFWYKYEKYFPFQVWWLEVWSIPFISWIVYEGLRRWYNVSSFIVRKDRKLAWLWNLIEWKLNDEKIIIVDDLINSWESFYKVRSALESEGKKVFKLFVFVNFGKAHLNSKLREENIDFDYEFTLNDFWLEDMYDQKWFKYPILHPDKKYLYSLNNPNKFLRVPKSNPLKAWENIIFAWEWWEVISINSSTWTLKFSYKINTTLWHKNILSSPAFSNWKIIFWWYDWNVHCIDENWKIIWINYDLADFVWSSPYISEKLNSVFIWLEHGWPNYMGSLVSLNLQTWEKKWEIFSHDHFHVSPEYNETLWIVIWAWNEWKLVCVKADSGKIIFERTFSDSIKWWFTFSPDSKTFYFWCFDKKIYSIDSLYGKIKFSYETGDMVYAKPLVIWNNIFIWSLDKYFYHLDNNWNLLNKIETFWKIFSQAIFIKDNIISFWSNDSYIYFYDFILKKVIFVIPHSERISTKMIYDEKFKSLYVFDFLNNLVKYNLNQI
jgi:orotate phosphoribosyltransferase